MEGWSIWPSIDGVHLATRDRPLDDREVRPLTQLRNVYANTRDSLISKIGEQNQFAAELRVCAR